MYMFVPVLFAVEKMYVRFAAFIPDVDAFDSEIFRLSPSEASCMDPQGRHLLEQTHLALMDASGRIGHHPGPDTGVYVGVMHMEFIQYLASNGLKITPNITTGNGLDFLIGRVSYTFGLTGPCLSTHTACSSSLVATHLAHTGLLNQEDSYAVSAGVFMVLLPGTMSGISQLQAFSPVGRCKTFDSSGDGYGRGEGCAVTVLAPSSDDTSEVLAVVCSTVVNQCGRSSTLTAPNGPAQTALVASALEIADASPYDVSFVAVHGTGTPLGDPIEMGALGQALSCKSFGAGEPARVVIGSVKSCFGHTEGTAGLTGALLAIQALSHQVILLLNVSKLLLYSNIALICVYFWFCRRRPR